MQLCCVELPSYLPLPLLLAETATIIQFKMALVDEAILTKLPFSEERMSWCGNIEANLAQRLEPKFSAMYVSQLEWKRTYPH